MICKHAFASILLITFVCIVSSPLAVLSTDKNETKNPDEWEDPWNFDQIFSLTEDDKKEFEKYLGENTKFHFAMLAFSQLFLWQLGYYEIPVNGQLDSSTKEALREYQKRRGLKVTGDINAETYSKLGQDIELIEPSSPTNLSLYIFIDRFWDSFFSSQGTWYFIGESEKARKHAQKYLLLPPTQLTKIRCDRSLGLCIEATAWVYGQLNIDEIQIYYIERWDDYEIVTKPYDSMAVRYVLRINRKLKTVNKFRTSIGESKSSSDVAINLRLKDGGGVWRQLYKQKIDKLKQARSLRFQNCYKKIQSFFDEVEKETKQK